MTATTITSTQNPRVKQAAALRDARDRAQQQRFLIDGAREIRRALLGGLHIVEYFVCRENLRTQEAQQALDELTTTSAARFDVSPGVLEKIAFGQRNEGLVAVARPPEQSLDELELAASGVVAVLVGLEKPGNVGAIVRSADAAGVAAVIVADPVSDLFNPNTIRASLGTIFTVPCRTATSERALAWLRQRGVDSIVAARPDAARDYAEVDLSGRTALVLGSEAAGLSDVWRAPEITALRLPMLGAADSLNVSATAAVLFYEALRQRRLARGATGD
ncbi:MAG: hypothetical protein KF708_20365 [Pirellulales bacterium]|nr:hypothetical protein [Pirellulales bacterium]